MSDTRYELRIQFDSPAAMGRALDEVAPVLLEAGIPMRAVQPDWVAIEDGDERPLSDLEQAAVDAATEQGDTPFGGTLEVDDDDAEGSD
jgi:hypothetical protein